VARLRALVPDLPRAAWVLLGGDALSALGSGLTLPFLLVYLHEVRGIGLASAGLAVAAIAAAGLVGNPVGGSLADRLGARQALLVGLGVAAAGALAVALVREPWHAFAAAGILGFGAAVVWPAQDALLAGLVPEGRRSGAFALRHATLNAGFALGALVAAPLVSLSSSRSFELIYVLDALTFLAFVPVLLLAVPDVRGAGRQPAAVRVGYREVLADRVFRRLWLVTALLAAAGYAQYHVAFPALVTGEGGLGAGALSLAFAANALTVVGAQLLVLKLTAGRRRSRALAAVGVLFAAAWGLTLLGASAGGGPAALLVFAVVMIVLGLGETLVSPTIPPLVNDLAPERLRGRYNGAHTLAWTSGFLVGPLVAGPLLAAGLGGPFLVGLAAACALAGLGLLRLERQLPPAVNLVGRPDAPQQVARERLDLALATAS
jgi:MFS family permease